MEREIALRFEDVHKSFGDKKVLQGLTLDFTKETRSSRSWADPERAKVFF